MRLVQITFGFASLALLSGASQQMVAQTASLRQPPSLARNLEPYTATKKTTRVQRLANGTTITHLTTVKEARDSNGRIYHDDSTEPAPGGDGEGSGFHFFDIHDPVGRVTVSWNSQSREAIVTHLPEAGQQKRVNAPQQMMQAAPIVRSELERPQSEQLGTKNINGLEATGTRITRVIPAGREGNDQPLTVIHETWTSTELGITVMSMTDDPRSGIQTMEITELERGEPDAALFRVPEGYTMRDRYLPQPE